MTISKSLLFYLYLIFHKIFVSYTLFGSSSLSHYPFIQRLYWCKNRNTCGKQTPLRTILKNLYTQRHVSYNWPFICSNIPAALVHGVDTIFQGLYFKSKISW